MQGLTRDVERQPIEHLTLSAPAVLLAGIAALNILSAVLALLAA